MKGAQQPLHLDARDIEPAVLGIPLIVLTFDGDVTAHGTARSSEVEIGRCHDHRAGTLRNDAKRAVEAPVRGNVRAGDEGPHVARNEIGDARGRIETAPRRCGDEPGLGGQPRRRQLNRP